MVRWADLATVVVYVFYDSDGDDSAADIPSADTQACFIMTCTGRRHPHLGRGSECVHQLGHSGRQLRAADSHWRQRDLLV